MNTTVNNTIANKSAIAKSAIAEIAIANKSSIAIATAYDIAIEKKKQCLNAIVSNGACSLVELSEKFQGICPVNIYNKDTGRVLGQQSCVDISETLGLTYYVKCADGTWVIYYDREASSTMRKIIARNKELEHFQKIFREFLLSESKEVEKLYNSVFDSNDRTLVTETTETTESAESAKSLEPYEAPDTNRARKKAMGLTNPHKVPKETIDPIGMGSQKLDITMYKDQFVVVQGHVQSGKTKFMMCASLCHISQGKHVIIVLRNSMDDKLQLVERFRTFTNNMQSFLKKNNVKIEFSPKILDGSKLKSDQLASEFPNIIICIANDTAISKVNTIIANTPNMIKNYTTIIDEVDYVYSDNTNVLPHLETLRANTYSTFAVSATVLAPMIKETIQTENNIIFLEKPSGYVGIPNLYHRIIPETSCYGTRKEDDIFESDPYLKTALEDFATSKLTDLECFDRKSGEWHPRYWLARITFTTERMEQALGYMSTTYKKCVSMVYTGSGTITMYVRGVDAPIRLSNGSTSTITKNKYMGFAKNTYHCFKNASPGLVIEWLHKNGGFKAFPRIIVFASKMAARSISFGGANHQECHATNRLWWHLTAMYGLVSSTHDQPELLQCLGRLCVVKHDTIPLILYTTDSVRIDMRNAYYLQEELVKRSIEKIKKAENTRTLAEIIMNTSVLEEKVSKHRDLIKKPEEGFKLKTVKSKTLEQKRGGWDIEKTYVNVHAVTGKELEIKYMPVPEEAVEEDGDVNSDEEVEELEGALPGKYTIIDASKVGKNTKMYRMIQDVIALLIENGEYNKEVLVAELTRNLVKIKPDEYTERGSYGILWSRLKNTSKFSRTNKLEKSSLLCWKQGSILMVMLTK